LLSEVARVIKKLERVIITGQDVGAIAVPVFSWKDLFRFDGFEWYVLHT
jgi:hypothetical protein